MLKTVGNPSTRYGDQTIIDGNLVIGTNGKGIDFSVTPGTGTSELLDDYEEGTWTPTGNGISLSSASGTYTKIGDTVHLFFEIAFPTTVDASPAEISGIPFSAPASFRNGAAFGYDVGANRYTLVAFQNKLQFYNFSGNLTTNANNSDKQYYGVLTYKV